MLKGIVPTVGPERGLITPSTPTYFYNIYIILVKILSKCMNEKSDRISEVFGQK